MYRVFDLRFYVLSSLRVFFFSKRTPMCSLHIGKKCANLGEKKSKKKKHDEWMYGTYNVANEFNNTFQFFTLVVDIAHVAM